MCTTTKLLTACILVLFQAITQPSDGQNQPTGLLSSGQTAIGIGIFVDSVSNIPTQYFVYAMLQTNPLVVDGIRLRPQLTNRRMLCKYYINGTLGQHGATCNVWVDGKLVDRFGIDGELYWRLAQKRTMNPQEVYSKLENKNWDNILAKLYDHLRQDICPGTAAVSEKALRLADCRLQFKSLDYHYKMNFGIYLIPGVDLLYLLFGGMNHSIKAGELTNISHNILLQANNVVPKLDDLYEIKKHYLLASSGLDSAQFQSYLTGKYRDILEDHRYLKGYTKELFGWGGKSMSKPYRKLRKKDPNYLRLYLAYVNMQRIFTEKHFSGPVEAAESVYGTYGDNVVKSKLLSRRLQSYVSADLRSDVSSVVYPLWTRCGTVLTLIQCGNEFMEKQDFDAAVQSYMGGMLLVQRLLVAPGFKEYLKSSIFTKLAEAYTATGQKASALIAAKLSQIHRQMEYTGLVQSKNLQLAGLNSKLSEEYCQLEQNARDARTNVIGSNILGAIMLAASTQTAVNAGKTGDNSLLTQSQTLSDSALSSFHQAQAIKQAAPLSGILFAEQSNDEGLKKELSADFEETSRNFIQATRPFFAIDFLEELSFADANRYSLGLMRQMMDLFPDISDEMNELSGNVSFDRKAELFSGIYASIAKTEMAIYKIESRR